VAPRYTVGIGEKRGILASRITLKKVKTFKGMDGVGINAVKAKIAEMAPSQRSSVRRGRQSSTKS
jgi:hypothetical protein